MSAYRQAHMGEWVTADENNLMMFGCCDCRLIHVVEFRRRGGRFQIRAWRNNRATAAARREARKKAGA